MKLIIMIFLVTGMIFTQSFAGGNGNQTDVNDHKGNTNDHKGNTNDHKGNTNDHKGNSNDHKGNTGDYQKLLVFAKDLFDRMDKYDLDDKEAIELKKDKKLSRVDWNYRCRLDKDQTKVYCQRIDFEDDHAYAEDAENVEILGDKIFFLKKVKSKKKKKEKSSDQPELHTN